LLAAAGDEIVQSDGNGAGARGWLRGIRDLTAGRVCAEAML